MVLIEFQTEVVPASPYGEVPIRLQIGGVDLFAWGTRQANGEPSPYKPLFGVRFATEGLTSVRLAKQRGRYFYELDEYGADLLFQIVGEDVIVACTVSGKVGQLPYASLERAWQEFSKRIYRWIVNTYPEAAADPLWIELDHIPPGLKVVSAEAWIEECEWEVMKNIQAIEKQ